MINLLPKKEKEALKKGLKLRFIVVASFIFSVSFLVGFIMLLPSYFLVSSYSSKTVSNAYFLESQNTESFQKIINLPEEVGSKLKFFQSNINNISVADYFSKIVEYLPQGVQLNSVSFSKNQNDTTILLGGVAVDRDSLVSFSTLLKKSNLFSDVVVPVSSLTKDKNLPFSMNIVIKN